MPGVDEGLVRGDDPVRLQHRHPQPAVRRVALRCHLLPGDCPVLVRQAAGEAVETVAERERQLHEPAEVV
ncbi:MAG TPA: hypothetical protein VKP64_09440 [Mycobacteriales bacterium]|nr:hypothetical protein [Mycobacteriales bacterium]